MAHPLASPSSMSTSFRSQTKYQIWENGVLSKCSRNPKSVAHVLMPSGTAYFDRGLFASSCLMRRGSIQFGMLSKNCPPHRLVVIPDPPTHQLKWIFTWCQEGSSPGPGILQVLLMGIDACWWEDMHV